MDDLAVFLRNEVRREFSWTSANCLLLAADWIAACGHPDPADCWRVHLTDEAAAKAVVDRAGGVFRMAHSAAREAGLRQTTNPVRRDVGVVVVRGLEGPVEACGICTGSRWAVRSPGGIWIGRADPCAAWRV